jgi:hypothetical protein
MYGNYYITGIKEVSPDVERTGKGMVGEAEKSV